VTDPLFRSVHSALAFAFGHQGLNGKATILGRLSSKELPGEGRGLSGLDGAAMAGMIQRHVFEDLGELQRSVVIAKFSAPSACPTCGNTHDTSQRVEAIEKLAHHTLAEMVRERPSLALRRALVRRYFGERIHMQDLAKRTGVHQNTATNQARKVHRILQKLEREAMHMLDESLCEIVGEAVT